MPAIEHGDFGRGISGWNHRNRGTKSRGRYEMGEEIKRYIVIIDKYTDTPLYVIDSIPWVSQRKDLARRFESMDEAFDFAEARWSDGYSVVLEGSVADQVG